MRALLVAAALPFLFAAHRLPWSLDISTPELSSHQRLLVSLTISIDPHKYSAGEFRDLFAETEFTDEQEHTWKTRMSLSRTSAGTSDFMQNAFVLPGDYSVSVSVCDESGLSFGELHRKVHVAALHHEPLAEAWNDLPRVEFFRGGTDEPDAWYLPQVSGQLHLPVATKHPVHIDVVVNTSPGDRATDSMAERRRNLTAMTPYAKAVSQLSPLNGTLDVELLDLAYRREARVTIWDGMKAFLAQNNPGIISVQALDAKRQMRSYFLDQVRERLTAPGDAERFVIVLSGPAFLNDQDPADLLPMPAGPVPHVFYIRCRSIPRYILEPRPRPRPGARPRPLQRFAFALPLDELEKPLNSPGARIFDVISPEQFRRVLAGIIGQISRA